MSVSSTATHVKRWYLREWRLYRELSQEQLAMRLGGTKATISKLERYQLYGPGPWRQKINDEWLGRYCIALVVSMQELAGPPESPRSIDDIIKSASPADQRRFRALAEAFVKPDK